MSGKPQNAQMRIGPSGNSIPFYEAGHKHTYEAPAFLRALGLNAFEYSFGHGITIGEPGARRIAAEMEKYDIALSAHAPYYINFGSADPETVEKSIEYVIRSVRMGRLMGGTRTVFHPGAQGGLDRAAAYALLKKNLGILVERLRETPDFDAHILCPETMGKKRQLGTVEEIVGLCALDSRLYPCFDFGHINSYTGGGLRSPGDFRRIIDYTFERLGETKTKNMHIHFSKIQYGQAGEIRHLTFADTRYGPEYAHLGAVLDEYRMTPVIICESKDYMSDDAVIIKNYHQIS
ncbi:MAG: TIM barrel protein [Clostridiales bacterium]|jgi:deoxyribonuclease-4|nr:TIM barrel protein [Clostridiales bacterium]